MALEGEEFPVALLAGEGDGNGLPAEKYEPEVWRFFFGMRSTVAGKSNHFVNCRNILFRNNHKNIFFAKYEIGS